MDKMIPHLWFDTQALEAATFYTTLFEQSKINWTTVVKDTPSGDSEQLSFTLAGHDFFAISAGPFFTFNPAISFSVYCDTMEEIQTLWGKLMDGGTAVMELDTYSFSPHYGWLTDRYGLSWQMMLVNEPYEQKIYPSLTFSGEQYLKAEEAGAFYLSVFQDAKKGDIFYYEEEAGDEDPQAVIFSSVTLENLSFLLSDMKLGEDAVFNEAISFMVVCEDQAEIDAYWEKLSAVPEAEQCGWLKDKYGVSWQITPRELDEMMRTDDEAAKQRVTEAFLQMKKFDIQQLRDAYAGE